jgi:DNA-binding Lrp family transcriptional regulator
MKLSELEGRVLGAMRLVADAPIPTVAAALGVKQSSVRHALQRMTERGVCRRFALINQSTLGYIGYDVTTALAFRHADERTKFFAHLSKSPEIPEVVETGGPFHCAFTVCSQSPADVEQYLQALGERFGPIFVNENIGVCLRYSIFSPKFLLGRKKALKDIVTVPALPIDPKIDAVDRKIISALANNGSASYRDLARSLDIPISTLSYRIKALEKNGTFLGYIYLVDARQFDHESFLIYLSLKSNTAELRKKIFDFCHSEVYITYLIEWLGYWQYGIGVIAPASTQASDIVNELYARFGAAFNELSLFPILKYHKVSGFPV